MQKEIEKTNYIILLINLYLVNKDYLKTFILK